jgi:hypothetical protein
LKINQEKVSDERFEQLLTEKRSTSALPVFHGNPKTAEILNFEPNFFYDAGSNSLKFGRVFSY